MFAKKQFIEKMRKQNKFASTRVFCVGSDIRSATCQPCLSVSYLMMLITIDIAHDRNLHYITLYHLVSGVSSKLSLNVWLSSIMSFIWFLIWMDHLEYEIKTYVWEWIRAYVKPIQKNKRTTGSSRTSWQWNQLFYNHLWWKCSASDFIIGFSEDLCRETVYLQEALFWFTRA